mgnify:CR=1 FL=1
MSNKDWDPNLTPEQNYILRQEGTESPGSSPLNNEKREGSYHCVGCGTKLFDSNTKYESGSGWPSFFKSLPDVFEEKTDMHIGYPRTEYHCKNVADITGTSLMMGQNQQENATAIMACV